MTETLHHRRAFLRTAAGGAVLFLASGCSFDLGSSGKATPASGGSGGTASSAPASGGQGSGDSDGSGSAAPTDSDSAQPVASGSAPKPAGDPVNTQEIGAELKGHPEAKLRVSTYPLKRQGTTLLLTASVTLVGVKDAGADVESTSIFNLLGNNSWYPYLIDSKNLAKYQPIGPEGSVTLGIRTDVADVKLLPGRTAYLSATFAAPPADVTTMDVMVVEGGTMVAGVKIV